MGKLARFIAVLTAVCMSTALVWDGSRSPTMGLDYSLYGMNDRPAKLVGATWPVEQMRNWAAQYDVDVVAEASVERTGEVVGFPAHSGSQFDRWIKQGYPCVRRPCVAKPRSLADDPREIQYFEIGVSDLAFMGPNAKEAATAAQLYFARQGWEVGLQDLNSAEAWLQRFRQLFPKAPIILAALIFLLTAGQVFSRSRMVGIQLLQGTPRWQLILSDAVVWTVWLFVGLSLALGGVFILAKVTVQAHFFSYVMAAAGAILLVMWVAGLAGMLAAHQILQGTSILEAVKGKIRFGLAFPFVYLLRAIVVLMSGVLFLSLNQTSNDLGSANYLKSHLGPFADYSTFSTNTGAADNREVRRATAKQLQPLYRDGTLVMSRAKPQFFYGTRHDTSVSLRSGDTGMVDEVNPQYLTMYPPRLADGRMLRASSDLNPRHVTVLAPQGTPSAVVDDVRTYARGMFAGGRLGGVPGWNLKDAPVDTRIVSAGSIHYAVDSDVLSATKNPILLVYPQDFVPGVDFAFTSEGLMVRSSSTRSVLERAPDLGKGITGFISLSSGLDFRRELLRETWARQMFELVTYMMIVPLATIAVVLMYTRQNARRIFVQALNGRPILERMPMMLVFGAVSVVVLGWLAKPRTATLDDLQTFGSTAMTAPILRFVSVGAVLLAIGVAEYVMFDRMERAIVSERGSET